MAKLSRDKIDKAVNDWAKKVVRMARGNLTREKGISTKSLWKSIRYRYNKNTVTFYMDDYGAFLDKGVSGTGKLYYRNGNYMPVPYNKSEADPEYKFSASKKAIGGSLKRWLRTKNLPESLDFVVRRSVHAKGIRPRRFFSDAWRVMLPEFNVVVGEAATVAVEETVDEILETLKD